ncbi:hypothetical protein CCP3SC1AL1_640006 [Gammaproteobacteria bacterium]
MLPFCVFHHKISNLSQGLFAGLLLTGLAIAETQDPMQPRGGVFAPYAFEEPAPWKEGETLIPPFPKEENLIEVPMDPKSYRCLLDLESLSLGADQVTKYTAVIVSKSGARSIFYEGLRCDNGEYKTFAYGSNNTFQRVRDPTWKRAADAAGSVGQFRLVLRGTLCDDMRRPLSPQEMQDRLRHPR